jgi:hypothetical protein
MHGVCSQEDARGGVGRIRGPPAAPAVAFVCVCVCVCVCSDSGEFDFEGHVWSGEAPCARALLGVSAFREGKK